MNTINLNTLTARCWNEANVTTGKTYNANDVKRLMDKYYASRTTLRLSNKENKSDVNINEIISTVWSESMNTQYDPRTVKKMVDIYYTCKLVIKVLSESNTDDKEEPSDE